MSQVSYTVANGSGGAVRTGHNGVHAAIKSANSGATAPASSPVAGMPWLKELSATCHEYRRYDGAAWRMEGVLNPTSGLYYAANDRKIRGLTLSNNGSDATNDIDVAVGVACADGDGFPMELTAAITKRLDAAWAVGTNQGGLDTGSIADTTYHVWLIRRSDTGVVDVLFSTSATSPTMPANYDQKRRIGSIIRSAGAIVTFRQVGDLFRRANVTDRNNTAAAASALLALSIPAGIVIQPIVSISLSGGASVTCTLKLGDAAAGSADTDVCEISTGVGDSSDLNTYVIPPIFTSNTSAQIYFSQTNTAGTPSNSLLVTRGWIDRRGQDS